MPTHLTSSSLASTVDPIVVSGKAILLGEHFVVYGAPAIALCIPRAVRIEVRAHTRFQLDIPQWGLTLLPDNEGQDLERALAALLERLPSVPNVRLTAELSLPSGVGLGSSASLGVGVLEALDQHAGWQLSNAQRYDLMFAWEGVFHGSPSGFDHATAMHDGLTYFERFSSPPIRTLTCPHPMHVIIAQIDAGASTRTMVEGVAHWKDTYPKEFARLLTRARARAEQMLTLLNTSSTAVPAWNTQVGALLKENHQDLQEIGVSTPALDDACRLAERSGAYGAKLIGAGGGGCILAWVDPSTHAHVYQALSAQSKTCFSLSLNDEVVP